METCFIWWLLLQSSSLFIWGGFWHIICWFKFRIRFFRKRLGETSNFLILQPSLIWWLILQRSSLLVWGGFWNIIFLFRFRVRLFRKRLYKTSNLLQLQPCFIWYLLLQSSRPLVWGGFWHIICWFKFRVRLFRRRLSDTRNFLFLFILRIELEHFLLWNYSWNSYIFNVKNLGVVLDLRNLDARHLKTFTFHPSLDNSICLEDQTSIRF